MSPVFRHGSLRLYLLRLLDEEPRHGYEVIRLLRDRFMGVYSPSPGTIYPRLARLEEEGLVTHDEVDGRKVYRITEAGRDELRSRSDELDELEEELSASVSDIVREAREGVRQTVRSLREELTWAARESRRVGRDVAADVREQARQAREEAWQQARQAGEQAKEQARQAKEQARDQVRQAQEQARDQPGRAHEKEPGEGPGPDAARRAPERARRLREETQRARDEAIGAAAGARFHAGEQDWDSPGGSGWGPRPSWTEWPGRRGWEDWTRTRGRPRLAGALAFGPPPAPKPPARRFPSPLGRAARAALAGGEHVISDLRTVLEDALERIKSESFGSAHEAPGQRDAGPDSPASPANEAKDSPTS